MCVYERERCRRYECIEETKGMGAIANQLVCMFEIYDWVTNVFERLCFHHNVGFYSLAPKLSIRNYVCWYWIEELSSVSVDFLLLPCQWSSPEDPFRQPSIINCSKSIRLHCHRCDSPVGAHEPVSERNQCKYHELWPLHTRGNPLELMDQELAVELRKLCLRLEILPRSCLDSCQKPADELLWHECSFGTPWHDVRHSG